MKIKIKGNGHHSNTAVVSLEDGTPIDGVVVMNILVRPGLPNVAELVVEGVHLDLEADARITPVPDGMVAEVVTVGALEVKSPDMGGEDKTDDED